MGIRFLCPNGHKLNVKADLAGKRALCPDCGAKLVVPVIAATTGARSVSATSAVAGLSSIALDQPSAILQTAPLASVVDEPPPMLAAAPSAPEILPEGRAWYVRPASGGQFGPATDDVFSSWIAEGRVAADAYVWRDDWPDWRLYGNGIDSAPTAAIATPLVRQEATAELTVAPPAAEATPEAEQSGRRQRTKRNQIVLAVLMLLALVLLAVALVYVIHRNATPVSRAFRPDESYLAQVVSPRGLTYERAV